MFSLIRGGVRDAGELTNIARGTTVRSWLYLAVIGGIAVTANYFGWSATVGHPDNVVIVLYLVLAQITLSRVYVRIERGRLTVSGIIIGAGAVLLNPLHATILGLALGIALVRRDRWPILANALMASVYACLGALVAADLRSGTSLSLEARLSVLLIFNLVSWVLVAVGLFLRTGESINSIVRHSFTPSFYLAFGYFALASLLVSYLLDGSLLGYFLTTIVFVLSLALTDTIAGRRVRRVLESELSDADRHLFHSRAVEGVVHNVRNHMATAVGYLKEIDLNRLDPVDREAVATATTSAADAVTVLRTLSQGATPKVSLARDPVDLNELVALAMGMARPRARAKEVVLALRESHDEVKVKADPLLLREVVTNLVNNAVDAAPDKGKVDVVIGKRGSWNYFSVADNGPGVAEENRHHLFEPHFTTKETGTGLGLFMSYGVIREHQGQLSYEGGRRGAVFTVTLPPYIR